jgi:NitT/TauT family transport system permease protein
MNFLCIYRKRFLLKEYFMKSIQTFRLKHKKQYNTIGLGISITTAFIVWAFISSLPDVGAVFVSPVRVWTALAENTRSGILLVHIGESLFRVIGGFALGTILSIPVAFLLGWYEGFRVIVEPWIQFFRTIPPIALIPIIIATFGIGTSAKIIIIFFSVFLTMVVTIYQGVKNVDATLVKAARVFDANDGQIFFNVVVPATFPFILTGMRLGLASALTTLVAAELTGATSGLGTMIQQAGMYFKMDVVLMGIIVIGIIGFIFDKTVLILEKKLTGWQEVL